MNFDTGGPGQTKTRCAYQGLGCAKEDNCVKRGEAVWDCPFHSYFVYLDAFSDCKGINDERNDG